jgi:hypothetical protein
MARVEVSCVKCGAKYVSRDLTEAMRWSAAHDEHCIGPDDTTGGGEA